MTPTDNSWRPTSRRHPSILIEHEGKTQSAKKWAKEKGVGYTTIIGRYRSGVRGDALFVPVVRGGGKDSPTTAAIAEQIEDLKQLQETKKAALSAPEIARLKRLEKGRLLEARRQQVAAEHAAAFGRPLIDGSLLSPRDRQANRDKVKYCGQLGWRADGGTKF